MNRPIIIYVDDQRDVLASLSKDLTLFDTHFETIGCESANEAYEILEEKDAEGRNVALIICDHVMPEWNGVDFLSEINEDMRFTKIKKLLLTGLATHEDTIRAINNASIDYYIEKPWNSDDLIKTVKVLITKYLLHSGIDYNKYIEILDQQILYRDLRKQT